MDAETTVLYRPVGRAELDLIGRSGWRAFPPRLAHQPFFYPVTNEAYAVQIARDWNTKDAVSGYTGFVTRFQVRSEFLARYPLQTAGAAVHQEYWIPAEDMEALNAAIVGTIDVVAEFRGEAPA
ncbi:MAG TPA: hypothetical protein VGB66_02325 [Longimicrobium sp.]|jgi:hypothetical protein